MAKKVVKKRKLRLSGLLKLLLIVGIIVLCAYLFSNLRIKNIIISGNNIVSDEEIIESANIENYPKFFLTRISSMKKGIEKNSFIKSVGIKRGFYNTIYISVKEYDVLFKNVITNKYILSNKKEVVSDMDFRVPILVNYVPSKKYKKLIEYSLEIDNSIFGKISEVKYAPNDYDKDRFLLYMDDGNSVYLTLTKFEMINYYNDVLPQLEGRRGILYLDSGNHFKIME